MYATNRLAITVGRTNSTYNPIANNVMITSIQRLENRIRMRLFYSLLTELAIEGSTHLMKSHTKELWMNVPQRRAIVSIHNDVERGVADSGVKEGLVLVNAMHITASVFINDNEPGLHRDYDKWLEELAPFDPSPERYHHNRTGEDNADAHHKRQLMGREVVVAITEGKLHLGPWEHIFYYEFDGRRKKRVLIKIIGE